MNSRYSLKRPNGPLLDVGSLPSAVVLRGAAGLQPGPCRFCRAGGVHGELEAGPSLAVRGIAVLLGGGEALAENFRDATGGLRGGGDDADLGVPVRPIMHGREELARLLHAEGVPRAADAA
jgi:hypothetical protein